MSHQGEPGQPGLPGEEGTGGGGRGGTGGTGGQGGQAGTTIITRGARYAVTFLFLFVLAIGAANLLFTARQVSRATQNAASIAQLCAAGNEARAQQLVLWAHIIQISARPAHETPAQRRRRLATLRAFEGYLHHVFAPRNCHAITH